MPRDYIGEWIRSRDKTLFCGIDLSTLIKAEENNIIDEIDKINANELLNTSTDDLCEYFVKKYVFDVPQIKMDKITVDQ